MEKSGAAIDAMTEKCFDEGQIQAFLDGELDSDSLEQAARHISLCNDCAQMLAEAESESTLAFAALDGELNSLVPTERIRTNLYEAIAAERKPFWQKIFGGKFSFTNPSIVAFASLALVLGIFTTLFVVREYRKNGNDTVAQIEKTPAVKSSGSDVLTPAASNNGGADEAPISKAPAIEQAVVKSVNRPAIQNAGFKTPRNAVKNQLPVVENKKTENVLTPTVNENLAGEEGYLKTIATLSETVNSRKDEVLRPSARVAFEKDLAIVDDSITKMQKEVRRDPKNEAAKQLLRSSYQNKIELLNSVADKNELMAALK